MKAPHASPGITSLPNEFHKTDQKTTPCLITKTEYLFHQNVLLHLSDYPILQTLK